MRKSLQAYTALATLMAASPAFAEDFTVQAPISGVKIHRSYGAIVSREVSLTLPAGEHRLFISDLTKQLNHGYGVRAGVKVGDAIITQVNLDEKFKPATGREAQQQLLTQIELLEQEQATDGTAIEAINMQLRFVENMAGTTANDAGVYTDPAVKMEALKQSFEFVKTTGATLLSERLAIEKRQHSRAEQIDALKQELAQTGGAPKSINEGAINVTVPKSNEVTLTLSYLVNSATWDVETQANLDTGREQASIRLFAKVSQTSGEDWSNVPLSLSTTRPSVNIAHIAPSPVYMNLRDPRQLMALERRKAANFEADLQQDAEPVAITGNRIAEYNRSQFDAEFTLNSNVSVPADGSTQTFLVDRFVADTETALRISPNWQRTAFLYADGEFKGLPVIHNPQAFLTRDGTFVGSGRWPTLGINKNLKLPFGVDEQIDVEVITVPSEDGDTGIFSKRRVDETKHRFLITNNHSKPMVIEVFDTLPNSMNEDLEVEPLRGATRATETNVDDQPGVIKWRKELAAGETWEINHWYRVSYPDGKSLVHQ